MFLSVFNSYSCILLVVYIVLRPEYKLLCFMRKRELHFTSKQT